jgi:branched-chain amino acid transport system substrate-binding protein
MRNIRLIFTLVIIVLFFVLILSKLYKPREFVVVVAGDTTSENSAIGNSIFFGVEHAFKEAGQLPHDFSIRIRKSPDHGKAEIVESVALESVADPSVIAVIGHSSSGDTKTALKVYRAYEMPILMPVATNPDLTSEQNGSRNVFRLVPKDNLQASTIAKFCSEKLKLLLSTNKLNSNKSLNPEKELVINSSSHIAIINSEKPYGVSLGKSLNEAFSNEGIKSNFLNKKNGEVKWSNIIQQDAPTIIVFAGYYKEGAELVNEIRNAGLKQIIILTDGCFPSDIFKIINKNMEHKDIYVSFIAKDWNNNILAKPLMDAAKKQPNIDTAFAPFAYDSFRIIYDSVSKILSEQVNGVNLNRKILLEYLSAHRTYKDKSYIAGPYVFADSGDNTNGEHYMYKLVDVDASSSSSEYNLAWEMVK